MLFIAQTALELGFAYALVSLALFLSYRILDIADLTTDGGFVLGMAVSVSCAASGHPFLGIFAAMAAGAAAGFVTAFLQTRLGVPSILAGIVTNTGLYTVNLMAMGWTSNINLLKKETIFTLFKKTGIGGEWYELLLIAVIVILAMILLNWFLRTRIGLSIRATGDNRAMVKASSINPAFAITVGLCIANALTALSGAIVGQMQKSADINGGTGIVVIGLACLIIGETVIGVPLDSAQHHCSAGRKHYLPFHLCDHSEDFDRADRVSETDDGDHRGTGHRNAYAEGVRSIPEKKRWLPPEREDASMLSIQNISKTFNPGTVNEKTALHDFSLNLEPGGFCLHYRLEQRRQVHAVQRGCRKLLCGRRQHLPGREGYHLHDRA